MKLKHISGERNLRFESDKCKGCQMCVNVCPHGVFEIVGGKAGIVDLEACMECGACAKNCPFGAISVKSGVGCAYAIINGMLKGTAPNCGCSDSSSGCCGEK